MKEPLVLLPGMMCDARLFGPQIAELSSDTVVMVAPITMGERLEETASALLDILPKRFALAGLSMGASWRWRFCAARPTVSRALP